ncbi:hypothetical protein GOODEAATRI_000059, partial [Goodea atripinnis]
IDLVEIRLDRSGTEWPFRGRLVLTPLSLLLCWCSPSSGSGRRAASSSHFPNLW